MVKEISLSTDALVLSNGVVLKRYDKPMTVMILKS